MEDNVLLGTKMKQLCDRIPDRDIVQPQLLKKYIQFARHTVFPKLSIEACEILKNFYIAMRENSSNNQNSLPITSRALDSIIRLSQARAKLELRDKVTKNDAIDVVKIVQESIFEACFTDIVGHQPGAKYSPVRGQQRSQRGGPGFDPNNVSMLSIPKQTKLFVERLREYAQQAGDKTYAYQDMVEVGKSMQMQVGDFR